jgi:hypothetical protein
MAIENRPEDNHEASIEINSNINKREIGDNLLGVEGEILAEKKEQITEVAVVGVVEMMDIDTGSEVHLFLFKAVAAGEEVVEEEEEEDVMIHMIHGEEGQVLLKLVVHLLQHLDLEEREADGEMRHTSINSRPNSKEVVDIIKINSLHLHIMVSNHSNRPLMGGHKAIHRRSNHRRGKGKGLLLMARSIHSSILQTIINKVKMCTINIYV